MNVPIVRTIVKRFRETTLSHPARPWKITTAVLAAVCVALTIALVVTPRPLPESLDTEKAFPMEDDYTLDETALVFPDTLPLFTHRQYDFGNFLLGEYDPAEIPYLDDWEQVVENEIWCDWFPDGTRLSLLRVRAQWNSERHHVYLLYAPPVETTDNRLEYHILYRIGEDYTGSNNGTPEAVAFANVLGYEGFKITISDAEDLYRGSHYISQLPDGKPCMVTNTFANGYEADVDDDGVLEIVNFDANAYSPGWEIVDTTKGEEGAFVYTLDYADLHIPDQYSFDFIPEQGGFILIDSCNSVVGRYVLRNRELVHIPATDFSVSDYPDVAGTEITFITDYEQSQTLSDGLDPDMVLSYTSEVRITHRQQAYIALQELYNMTGIRLDSCYCTASEYGVHFSLLPDGFNERGFFSAYFGEDCGGTGIPSFHISWREDEDMGCGWSPLSFEEALHPEGGNINEEIRWYYERMWFFSTGEVNRMLCIDPGPDGVPKGYRGEGEFYLTDGSLYMVHYTTIDGNPALTDLYGPYPDGQVNH